MTKEGEERIEEFIVGSIKSHEASLQLSKDIFTSLLHLQTQVAEQQKEINELKAVISAGSGDLKH